MSDKESKSDEEPKVEEAAAAPADGSGEEKKVKRKKSRAKSKSMTKAAEDGGDAKEKEAKADADADDDAAGDAGSGDAADTATTTVKKIGLPTEEAVKSHPFKRVNGKVSFVDIDPKSFVPYPEDCAPFATSDPTANRDVRVAEVGIGAAEPFTVIEVFKKCAETHGDKVALRVERDGEWKSWTWQEYFDQSKRAARAFVHLGLERYGCVNVIGFNSPEWLIANVGAILAGGKAAGIYTSNQSEACKYITEHSKASVVVLEDEKQLAKFLPLRTELPNLRALVLYKGTVPDGVNDDKAAKKSKVTVYDWSGFMELADKTDESVVDERMDAQKPGEAVTLIYTSGTTGNPKAVMISHDNLTWTTRTMFGILPDGFGDREEHIISYLPLSHVAAQMLDIHLPMAIVAHVGGNCTVHFARPDALKGSLGETLRAVRPTLFFGVPRVWEKMADKIKAIGAKTTGFKKTLGNWAKGKMSAAYDEHQYDHTGKNPFLAGVAAKILNKVKMALGLDRCVLCLTGAAPIQHETLRYYGSLGLEIYELYGMSECTGPQNVSFPGHFKIGSCGPPLPGCELKLDHEASRDKEGEGEICYRGRHIMLGYMFNDEKTKEAIDPEGWLHSGDVGAIDKDGFLSITGRIKELIITAGGENVAPRASEEAVLEAGPAIKNIMMVGDKRKYNVCLITLHLEANEDGTFSEQLTGPSLEVDEEAKTVGDAQKSDKWKTYVETAIKAANEKAVSNAAKIQKFHILATDFTPQGGHLTETLKLKRSVVAKMYEAEIDALYGETVDGKKVAAAGDGDAAAAGGKKEKSKRKSTKKEKKKEEDGEKKEKEEKKEE